MDQSTTYRDKTSKVGRSLCMVTGVAITGDERKLCNALDANRRLSVVDGIVQIDKFGLTWVIVRGKGMWSNDLLLY
ncbi:hypothetical protein F2P81_001000 [Scophthalmus maximus]|uniref:Uncharacterized protein n=1 Tax=Scophthalmus maximus TaxID=52904 RepID=A0A6A4TKI5_SCOMX|nr:hypothetical protein F2P81_001000 [Scophthalmus maximus]